MGSRAVFGIIYNRDGEHLIGLLSENPCKLFKRKKKELEKRIAELCQLFPESMVFCREAELPKGVGCCQWHPWRGNGMLPYSWCCHHHTGQNSSSLSSVVVALVGDQMGWDCPGKTGTVGGYARAQSPTFALCLSSTPKTNKQTKLLLSELCPLWSVIWVLRHSVWNRFCAPFILTGTLTPLPCFLAGTGGICKQKSPSQSWLSLPCWRFRGFWGEE